MPTDKDVLADSIGEVSTPSGNLPYKHFIRLREPRDDEVGKKLYALSDAEVAALRRLAPREPTQKMVQTGADTILKHIKQPYALLHDEIAEIWCAMYDAAPLLPPATPPSGEDAQPTPESRASGPSGAGGSAGAPYAELCARLRRFPFFSHDGTGIGWKTDAGKSEPICVEAAAAIETLQRQLAERDEQIAAQRKAGDALYVTAEAAEAKAAALRKLLDAADTMRSEITLSIIPRKRAAMMAYDAARAAISQSTEGAG